MHSSNTDPWAIVPNPGGPVDPADHIGHAGELQEVLLSIAAVGALVAGDRRMGKTSLLLKVEEALGREHLVLRISAETEDPQLFARRLLDVLRGHHVFAEELKRWDVTVDVGYAGIRLQRRPRDGDTEQSETVDDLFAWAAAHAAPSKLVVMIDEVTVLASAIEQQHPGGALEFLRSFRRPRQELRNVAVILAGSVGIHHAVRKPEPINDLRRVRVGPLDEEDAVFLARCLLLGGQIDAPDELATAAAMADASDGIPYYLHHLAAAAQRRGEVLTPDGVWQLRDAALTDPDDPWNIRHYRDRIPDYYGEDADVVKHVLDAHARVDVALTVDDLAAALGSVEIETRPTRDDLLRILEDVEADHYLVRTDNQTEFASRILRDAWRAMRRI